VNQQQSDIPATKPHPGRRAFWMLLTGCGIAFLLVVWFSPRLFVPVVLRLAYTANGVHPEKITLHGHNWGYLSSGNLSAPPVLMLHGFGSDRESQMSMMPWLAGKHFCIAPDLPGFGNNGLRNGEACNADFYVSELLEFADALGLRKFDLVGTSMGGALAAYFAAKHPDRVNKLILLAPAGLEPTQKNYFMRGVDRGEKPLLIRNEGDFDRVVDLAFDRNPYVPWQFRRWYVDRAIRNQADTLEVIRGMDSFLLNGLANVLPNIQCPTLIVWGDRDLVIDPSLLKRFVNGIPNSKGVLINDGGHIVSDDSPEETRRAMVGFLDREPTELSK
jgi:pimeloyl-ACP methyl ester carboxylesterase